MTDYSKIYKGDYIVVDKARMNLLTRCGAYMKIIGKDDKYEYIKSLASKIIVEYKDVRTNCKSVRSLRTVYRVRIPASIYDEIVTISNWYSDYRNKLKNDSGLAYSEFYKKFDEKIIQIERILKSEIGVKAVC